MQYQEENQQEKSVATSHLNDLSKMVYHSTVSEISDYAFKKFFDDRFDEVEAEYMVRMRR